MTDRPWRTRFFAEQKPQPIINRDRLMVCKTKIDDSFKTRSYDEFKLVYQELRELAEKDPTAAKLAEQCYQQVTGGVGKRILPEGYDHKTITQEVFNKFIAQLDNQYKRVLNII